MKKFDDTILYKFADLMVGKYKDATVFKNVASGVLQQVEIQFHDTFDNELIVSHSKKNDIYITGVTNASNEDRAEVLFGKEFKWVSMEQLFADFHSCVLEIYHKDDSFFKECEDSLVAFGMKASDNDRIYGKPKLIADYKRLKEFKKGAL